MTANAFFADLQVDADQLIHAADVLRPDNTLVDGAGTSWRDTDGNPFSTYASAVPCLVESAEGSETDQWAQTRVFKEVNVYLKQSTPLSNGWVVVYEGLNYYVEDVADWLKQGVVWQARCKLRN